MKFEDKHAPRSFSELIFEDLSVTKKLSSYAANKRNKHLMLYGPPGTAKTSACILIAADRLGGDLSFVDVLQASLIKDDLDKYLLRIEQGWNAQLGLVGADFPVVVINEVDQLSIEKQQKLRGFMEASPYGLVFFTTNNIASVEKPLRDRCECIEVRSLTTRTLTSRALQIVGRELDTVNAQKISALMQTCNGSWRDALCALEDYVAERK